MKVRAMDTDTPVVTEGSQSTRGNVDSVHNAAMSTPDEDAPGRSCRRRRHRSLRPRWQPDVRAEATWRLRAYNGPGG